MNPVLRAISLLNPQTKAELARVCGQKPQAVTRWVRQHKVPAIHARKIEEATQGQVTRYELCADVFGADVGNTKSE